MIDDKPDMTNRPPQSQKLVLPAHDENAYSSPNQHTQRGHVLPEHLVSNRPISPPIAPFSRKRSWRNDPAYVVLLVAVCMVLTAGTIFAVAATNLFSGNTQVGQVGPVTVPTTGAPQGTVDTHPQFPTPGGNQGGTVSSQPPKTGSTPIVQPPPTMIPTVQPTPTQGQSGPLTVQITDIQSPVNNNSIDPVSVTTSGPGVRVRLLITYNASPGFASVGPQTTDDNGNATLDWNVSVNAFGTGHVKAHVTAIAQDQNGQEATSQVMTVQIIVKGIFGG